MINNEYSIDRTNIINQIKNDGFNFMSIQGEAGSGKSALCKMLLQNESLLLYTRAEKFSEVNSIDEIWSLNIRKTVKYLKNKKLFIYIDALEFIADCLKTKMDLLQELYETVKEYKNVYIVTSCRTSDRNAFIKLDNIYNIQRYDISILTDEQISAIATKYKVIQDLWNSKSYNQLLRSPFYINLIVKKIIDYKDIKDVENFRELIWNEVICLSGKKLPNGIMHSDLLAAINTIVFTRAKNFHANKANRGWHV